MGKHTFLISVLVILVGFGGFIAYREYKNRGEEIAPALKTPIDTLGSAALIADSDKDGLKDWEEELWRTDPLNTDTDRDGMGDAEEIKNGRNPLIAGANALLDSATVATKVNPDAKKSIPDTERFARELFATYLSSRQEGLPLSQNEIANIIDTVSASVPDEAPQLFSEKDAKTFTEENESALRAYGNALGAVLKKPWPSRENELAVFERAIQDPNPETARLDLANLTPISLAYGNLGNAVMKIPVPQNALAIHLRFANTTMEIRENIRGMSVALDDPIKTVSAIARYLDAAPRLGESLTALRNFLETRGISYTEDENGYALWRATQI
ncbi:MAG: Ricin B lectin [Parcubacteria group bacterium GW2011_GWA2_47_12]|nr:MAG: Ricin B lectin [Parcubacteria group bacterium GW2011_GWA2_47_12]